MLLRAKYVEMRVALGQQTAVVSNFAHFLTFTV